MIKSDERQFYMVCGQNLWEMMEQIKYLEFMTIIDCCREDEDYVFKYQL